jgi:hypothetical protein
MWRGISTFLVLFFGLWPLTGMLEASDDSRLPPCCRRHGAHHCAMAMQMAAMMAQAESGSTPMLTAPMTCPLFPGFAGRASAPSHALATSAASLPVLLAQGHSPATIRADARMIPIRTRAARAPPQTDISL